MKKILTTIIMFSIASVSIANDEIYKIINDKKYSSLPSTVEIDDDKYNGKVPLSVYLLINKKETDAIELLSSGNLNVSQTVLYKGNIYSDIEWAEINGFSEFAKKARELNLINSSKEDNIKRNRDLIFTNMERLLPEIQKEKKIIEKLRDKGVEAILKSEDKDQILINLLVKLIIDGHNDAATLIIKNIKDVNKFSNTGVSPLMATGFTNKLEGGNVEFANILIFNHNADVNLKNEKGMTAVHIASAGNAFKTLTTLINNQANFMSADKTGNMSIDYAIKAEAEESLFVLHKSIEILQKSRNIK